MEQEKISSSRRFNFAPVQEWQANPLVMSGLIFFYTVLGKNLCYAEQYARKPKVVPKQVHRKRSSDAQCKSPHSFLKLKVRKRLL